LDGCILRPDYFLLVFGSC